MSHGTILFVLCFLSFSVLCHGRVLILGGGVTGIIAARTLRARGITDFLIVEARDMLGGRMQSHELVPGVVVERGANWVQGTQQADGPANPIYTLAVKHGLVMAFSDYESLTTYDMNGQVDYYDALSQAGVDLDAMSALAGLRIENDQVDMSGRAGYLLSCPRRIGPYAQVAEYWEWDFEFAQTPEQSSWHMATQALNSTFNDFSDQNLFSVDQRGFSRMILAEAEEFLHPSQVKLSSTVQAISYSPRGVTIELTSGEKLTGNYAICTFSVGVLQHDNVTFHPELPAWKREAILSHSMATYTKIFLQFEEKFWFDTQFALYADLQRGRYPIWQNLDAPGLLPGSRVLVVTVTGDESLRVESLTDAQVQAEVLATLGNMYPNATIPEPVAFYFPRWHADPLFRGSYSNWPASFVPEHLLNLKANLGRLRFAGEATSAKYFGFLQGAYFEGLDIGERVADCVKRKKSCRSDEHFDIVVNAHSYDTIF